MRFDSVIIYYVCLRQSVFTRIRYCGKIISKLMNDSGGFFCYDRKTPEGVNTRNDAAQPLERRTAWDF